MNLTPAQWAYIIGVALPMRSKHIKQWYVQFMDYSGDHNDLIRLALERADYDQKTAIMAMVLGGKDE